MPSHNVRVRSVPRLICSILCSILVGTLAVAQELPPPKPKKVPPKKKEQPKETSKPKSDEAQKAQPEKPDDGKPVPALLIMTNAPCLLTVDGEEVGAIGPAESAKVDVALGEHIVRCSAGGVTREETLLIDKPLQRIVRLEFARKVELPIKTTVDGTWKTLMPGGSTWSLRLDQSGPAVTGTLTRIYLDQSRVSQEVEGRSRPNGSFELTARPVMERRAGVLRTTDLVTLNVRLVERGYKLIGKSQESAHSAEVTFDRID